ncbi:hypothetical protein ACD578_28910 (plasmid) [Microvirga sp. RSM25]|uniref:hypothetical protein n=1 Tax=Microvirga sp. RSM25 TaxID=3273802 RepID=UPI00384FFC58
MPHVIIKHFPANLDRGARERLKSAIAEAIRGAFRCDPGAISIALQDVPPDRWHEAVYEPDIQPHIGRLLKSPDYQSRSSNG